MNTPIGHRITDLRAIVNQLRVELPNDPGQKVRDLLDSIEKQMDGLEAQLRIDRDEASRGFLDPPGFIDTSI